MIPYAKERKDFYPLADVEFDMDGEWEGWWKRG